MVYTIQSGHSKLVLWAWSDEHVVRPAEVRMHHQQPLSHVI
jgi:hypothetical protein